ncbi:hypothetical protein PCANB_000871 [Pneumocystis canis]|nr:hypothetical protein PCK1_000800 [Pneumocystis canis]KAG5437439.1 hypothetical protein PCANB_000871 [Pneumocystis canis]
MATLYSFQSRNDLKNALCQYIQKAYNESLIKNNRFYIAISGGSLPKIIAESIKNLIDINWSKWEIFFADERVVPLCHQDSNYRLCHEEIFTNLPIPTENIHCINISLLNDPQKLSKAYESTLMSRFHTRNKEFPQFDLLLLGCGQDGHTCSLFPNHENLQENISWVIPVIDSPKPPPIRITLSLPVIINAQRIVFIVLGTEKKKVMKEIWNDRKKELPCSLINTKASSKVLWFSDTASTELVDEKLIKPFKL